MNQTLRNLALLGTLSASTALSGCATVAGTAVSPITGGVDLCVVALRQNQWYYVPLVFLGGAIAGPFVAFYNGVNYDAKGIGAPTADYWDGFGQVFRPWKMIL